MIEIILLAFILLCLLITLAYTAFTKDILGAALGATLISLIASIIFVILKAPDVAITEASIGAALSGAIMIGVIVKIRKEDR